MGVQKHMGIDVSWRNNGAATSWGEESPKVVVGPKRWKGSTCLGLMGAGFQDKELGKDV